MELYRYTLVIFAILIVSSFVSTQGWLRRARLARLKRRLFWNRHKIRPKLDNNLIICKWKSKGIRCRNDKVLSITSALFGRMDKNTCRPRRIHNGKCTSNITQQIRQQCQGKSYCKITVSKSIFEKYCPNREGYLQLKIRCVNKAPLVKKYCESKPCKNGGICQEGVNGYKCTCRPGFTGNLCQTVQRIKKYCGSNPCKNGGLCKEVANGYMCTCKLGYTGKQCQKISVIDRCASTPCKNGGRCKTSGNSFICTCKPGFTGKQCQININDCATKPCKNGGQCKDGVNGYMCICRAGYTGKQCQINKDDCAVNPCKNGGICKDGVNSFTCICKYGFSGKRCELAPCFTKPCKNGGTCKDKPNGYICSCKPGFVGVNCQIGLTCKNKPCANGGVCKDVVDGYLCTCKPGFTGVNCQIDIDDCVARPCKNGGVCKDQVNGYKCTCKPGFVGDDCGKEAPVDCGTPYWNPTFIAWRIVGGIAARNFSWPWIVQLRLNNKHECGGAIIAPQWVATARHCFLSNRNPGHWTILAGRTHKSAAEPMTEQIRTASKIIPCPNPTSSFLNKDICLVKVSQGFTFNRYVRPICLPERPVKLSDRCYVKGWGSTYGTGHDQVLKQTHLPVKNTTLCNSTINGALAGQITNDMFCAGHANGGHDACQGDSGGPFDCQYADGKWYLSGIVSWGIGCAKKNMPGVYANVINFVQWIEKTMSSS